MERVTQFSLETHTGPCESWPLKSRLFSQGIDTGTRVPGYIIEGQFAVGDKFLLVTSYDCPSEESNNFLLLDRDFRIVCKKHIGAMYSSFLILDLSPIAEDELLITFAGDTKWKLTIRDPRPLFRSYFRFSVVSENTA